MGMRPLTGKELATLEKKLKVAREHLQEVTITVENLEKQLKDGTVWCYDPEEFKKMQEEVKAKVTRWKEGDEAREIDRYGRLLTDKERSGIVERPEEIKQ